MGHMDEARGHSRSERSIARRVRRRIRRVCSHPNALSIEIRDQSVVVGGPILGDEHELVIVAVGNVAGVVSVRNRLTAYPEAGTVPELQGPDRRDWRRRWAAAAKRVALPLLGLGLFWSAARIARRSGED